MKFNTWDIKGQTSKVQNDIERPHHHMGVLLEELAKNEFGNTQKFVKNNKIKVLIENGKESFTIIMSFGQQNFF